MYVFILKILLLRVCVFLLKVSVFIIFLLRVVLVCVIFLLMVYYSVLPCFLLVGMLCGGAMLRASVVFTVSQFLPRAVPLPPDADAPKAFHAVQVPLRDPGRQKVQLHALTSTPSSRRRCAPRHTQQQQQQEE